MATTQSTDASSSPPREGISADHIGILIAAVAMAVSGWWGLYQLITQTIPRVGQRWIFFMLLHIAVTGTVIPMIRFLNVRFTPVSKPIPGGGIILRQASWVGLFAVTCAWLQIPRALTWSVVVFLGIILVVLE